MAMVSQLDQVFRALSDATRREIIHDLLTAEELTAGQIAARFDSAQPTISKHLRVLQTAGLVSSRALGRNRLYRVAPGALAPVSDWLSRHTALWDAGLDRLGQILDDAN